MSDISLPVVIAAPTGLAAFNIGGTTIHRVLSLTVEHSSQLITQSYISNS